jgi:hypothetical protein
MRIRPAHSDLVVDPAAAAPFWDSMRETITVTIAGCGATGPAGCR